jgi:hypothetical protein
MSQALDDRKKAFLKSRKNGKIKKYGNRLEITRKDP